MRGLLGQFKDLFLIRSKIGKRLLVFMVLISVVPLLSMGLAALIFLNFSHRQDVSSAETQIIRQKQEEVNNFVQEIAAILNVQLDLNILRLAEPAQKGKCPPSSVGPENGRCYYFAKGKSALDNILEGILRDNKALQWAAFVDISGEIAASNFKNDLNDFGGEIILPDISGVSFFQSALEGNTYIGPVNYTAAGPTIIIAAPFRATEQGVKEGRVVGVVVGEASLKEAEFIMRRTFLGSEGYAFLVDKSGRLIAHSKQGVGAVGMDLSEVPRIKNILAGAKQTGLEEEDKFVSFWGEEVIAAGETIPGLGWGVFVEWPVQDADAIIAAIEGQIIDFTFISLLAMLFVVLLIVARLMKPIKSLEQGARAIGEGQFDYRVEIKTKDELEDLGATFNKMAKGLKRLQELKNEFVFVATHELRTPVTAIKGYLSMMFESGMANEPKISQYLKPVQKASEDLSKLVDNLLEVARSEAGRLKVEVGPQDIVKAVKDVFEEIKPLALEKKLNLVYAPAAGLPKVMADQDKLKEVLTNLASNAIKYNKEGGEVKISHEQSGENLITHVADTGAGMSAEDQKKLFTKFFRAEKTAGEKGTGLGLFITKELIERMGGKIWVKSQVDKGSTFSFSLRIAK